MPPPPVAGLKEAIASASTESVQVSDDSPVVGKTLGELDLRGKTGATVIAVVHGDDTKISPGANYKLCGGDTVVLLGASEKIERALDIIEPDGSLGGFNP